MLECSDTIISGIAAVMKYCDIPNCIIASSANKPDVHRPDVFSDPEYAGRQRQTAAHRYPQGAEKTLVETCTAGKSPQVGPSGKAGLPADVGCIIMNVTSVSTLGKYLKTGMPLITKRVTVEGDAIVQAPERGSAHRHAVPGM